MNSFPPYFQPGQFPKIMGILNVTPDSFSDGGKYFGEDQALAHAEELIADGAEIVDIGGESTRPGAKIIPESEEIQRVIPIITTLRAKYSTLPISIDTVKSSVAEAAIRAGATMINDISGLTNDVKIADIAAQYNVPLIIMHIQGTPQTMQIAPHYENVVDEVYAFLSDKIEIARKAGVRQIIADVGIGFGKSIHHNLELLRNHQKFCALGVPLLLGISRKSFIGMISGKTSPQERDIATAFLHALLLQSGADIIRVHNVSLLWELKTVYTALYPNY